MMVSIFSIVILTYMRFPVPEAISTIPAICLAALVGLLGKTHPDTTAVVPDVAKEAPDAPKQ